MSDRPDSWPESRNELLPHTLFKLAEQYPDLTYIKFPKNSNDISAGYRKVTFRQVANAVHAMAWWIERTVGKPDHDDGRETMVYMGPNDLRYAILCLGAVVVGYKMLFPSPRYGTESLVALINQVNSTIMLTPEVPLPVAGEVLEQRDMRNYSIPTLEYLITAHPEHYHYTKTYAQHQHEPLVSLHTSGTTGHPKPILWSHAWVNSVAEAMYLATPPGFEKLDALLFGPQKSVLFLYPPFHASGLKAMTMIPLLTGATIVYPPHWSTPAECVDGMISALSILPPLSSVPGKVVDSLCMPPPVMEYIGSDANARVLEKISRGILSATWAGGDISVLAGNAVARKMDAFVGFGSTEMGLMPSLRRRGRPSLEREEEGEGWHYITFHPALNLRFDPIPGQDRKGEKEAGEGKIYEAVMVRNDGQEWDGWVQAMFTIYPDIQEKRLGDLFIRHPRDEASWKHHGRADDLLVFSTNEKFHPGTAERRIAAYPSVSEVIMVGTRRTSASLILGLEGDKDMEGVWQTIEEVNKTSPVYARVARGMVLVVDEPFLRTAKGTVQKKAMVEKYERELDKLYKKEG
ncbi:acetyl-CoA synthetase-like protein [Clathrospora elynae]|uniref:Acetyl-CoA synthetase-like protein n=1 Tax=Clathrospora elynae TaxID=706981 RepID=A0A6A5T2W1_9PLEO|nr:acetyl-CoA synthetase-like protein [Clathrospora elynae]